MPRKPAKPCARPGCPNLTHDRFCEEHRDEKRQLNKEYDSDRRNKKHDKFYHSVAWKSARQAAMASAGGLCQHCLDAGMIVDADVVDHIIPVDVDWSRRFNMDNLQPLCHSCHAKKTSEDKRRHRGGV